MNLNGALAILTLDNIQYNKSNTWEGERLYTNKTVTLGCGVVGVEGRKYRICTPNHILRTCAIAYVHLERPIFVTGKFQIRILRVPSDNEVVVHQNIFVITLYCIQGGGWRNWERRWAWQWQSSCAVHHTPGLSFWSAFPGNANPICTYFLHRSHHPGLLI